MLDAVGITYGVVIQISVHGNDNRLIARALRQYPNRLRGVVSIDGSESQEELEALRPLGVCGIRINEHFSGGVGADQLQRLADRCRPLGWHLDLGLNGQRLRELAGVLRQIAIPLVIDHMGFCRAERGIEHAEFANVLELVQMPNCWIKLSGGYRLTSTRAPYEEIGPFVRALCRAAPDRTIWAADWPNVALNNPDTVPETGEQLDALFYQLGDWAQCRAVLVHNPMRLYGRPGTVVGARSDP
jgi:2-pyrone-4,6-dicarboxylate lactonase